ncbi:Ccs1p [Sugiyamaella lignohabitans]|uniref:Ccs1p n=1 Tax=Sugiyamaella lignohabitans TaxID=796027 RepID=A0A167EVZ9_9ASCO|nr:Ccs1p [Sugiyamaella lignohabitans]ANB14529.1 Ccs1p [Sugiyamaella lignohabitans]
MQNIGKDAIVRGTGEPNSAAVCILESFEDEKNPVKGLARIVGVSPTRALFDITLNGLPKGKYYPSIRVSGDLSQGAVSTGPQLVELGEIDVSAQLSTSDSFLANQPKGFSGHAVFTKDVSISDIIGRGLTVSKSRTANYPDSLVGVIARSAGIWENLKSVCSCSGKTVWEERSDAISSGIH